jgi:NAD(P)-dependent dehydrogenase (short-subunit alcohol dehydrogenase family)
MIRESQVVVITGASAGIGRATAVRFARKGWRVAVLARDNEGLDGARREIVAAGSQALAVVADVADYGQVEAAARQVEETWGRIDVWVNCAMATVYSEFEDMAPDEFRRATEVTYLGTVWGTRIALSRMRKLDCGTIVQVGSALAYRSIPLQSAYCGAKSAVRGFTDSLRSELIHARSRIHLTMVQLSAFNTPQFEWGRTHRAMRPQPLPPIFQPEVAADAIYYAATHRRREVWVGFPAVKAIVGTRLFPGLLDRVLARVAYAGQHTNEPVSPDRRDNLFAPVPGDHGAHGRFDSRAKSFSAQSWLDIHPYFVLGAAIGMAALMKRLLRAR